MQLSRFRSVWGGWWAPIIILSIAMVLQALFLQIQPISIEADGAGYYMYARKIAGLKPNWFMWWRTPGYPIFLHYFGLTWADTFDGVIIANAAAGIAMPLLLYGAISPINKAVAFGAALVFCFSTLPFSYVKVLTNDHVFAFLIVLATFGFARFVASGRYFFIVLMTGAFVCAAMVRNEGLFIAGIALAILAIGALQQRDRQLIRGIGFAAVVLVMALTQWSLFRAIQLHRPLLIGSLHNASGRQLFWRLYAMVGVDALSYNFSRPDKPDDVRWATDHSRIRFVLPENGPASLTLAKRFPREFLEPTDTNASHIVFGPLIQEMGVAGSDAILRKASYEALLSHPDAALLLLLSSAPYFGFHFPGPSLSTIRPNWVAFDPYEEMPVSVAEAVALPNLTPSLRSEFFESSAHSGRQFPAARELMFNWTCNIIGLAFLLAAPVLILFSHSRPVCLYATMSVFCLVALSTIGFGYNPRYQHAIAPLMILGLAVMVAPPSSKQEEMK
jgi:hypothetical protein